MATQYMQVSLPCEVSCGHISCNGLYFVTSYLHKKTNQAET